MTEKIISANRAGATPENCDMQLASYFLEQDLNVKVSFCLLARIGYNISQMRRLQILKEEEDEE